MDFIRSACTAFLCAALLPPAFAEPAAPVAPAAPAASQQGNHASASAPEAAARFRQAMPAPPAALDDARGGTGSIASTTQLRGTADGNSATNVVTGNNAIQSGSFANATGIPVVIQNSGANVLIQNATVVNLQFQ